MRTDAVFVFFTRLLWWTPLEGGRVHRKTRFLVLGRLEMLLDQLWRDTDHMLTLGNRPRLESGDSKQYY